MKRVLALILLTVISFFFAMMMAISPVFAQEETSTPSNADAPILVPCIPEQVALNTTQPLLIYDSGATLADVRTTYVVTRYDRGDVACVISGFITLYTSDGQTLGVSDFSLLANGHGDGLLVIGEAAFVVKRESEWLRIVPSYPQDNGNVVALKFGAFPPPLKIK